MSSTAAAVTVEACDLSHRFASRVALEPQTFSLIQGTVAVTGPNGSGKSTLLRIVAGLLRPSAGAAKVTLEGRDLAPNERRHALGLLSPELSFYEEFTARENLEFAAEARGLRSPRESATAALERAQLISRANDRVGALSSGLKQRLRLAFALLGTPPLLLLDEPGSHMDDEGRALVESVVSEASRRGLVLLATNDEREWRLAERRIELRGRDLGRLS